MAPGYSPASAVAHVEAGGVMSKTLYLIGLNGAFLHWCPGCLVRTERNDVIVARNPHGYRVDLCQVPYPAPSKTPGEMFGEPGFLKAQEDRSTAYARTVRGCLASWQQAIIAAPDGALLRWDEDRRQVVDELEEDEEAFAEPHLGLTDLLDVPGGNLLPAHCPTCLGCGLVDDPVSRDEFPCPDCKGSGEVPAEFQLPVCERGSTHSSNPCAESTR